MTPLVRWIALLCSVGSITACAVGPNYHRPPLATTASYKEQQDWKPSEPNDALNRGPWWSIFRDDDLTRLETQINISNENVKAAVAAYDQAQGQVAQARASYWPSIGASLGAQRGAIAGAPAATTITAGVTGDWTLDVWGQIRRTVESDRASAQASAAALAAAELSAQATLATDYFELRAQDQLQRILDDIVDAEDKSLKITESRYKFGVAAKADVVTAQTQLLNSQAQQVNARIQRGILEHAIAVLIGQQPAAFALPPTPMRNDVPTVPAGVPSTLLERRPDVAEAERRIAAANAQIGVATAAYFPALTLTGSDDYTNNAFSRNNHRWRRAPRRSSPGAGGVSSQRRRLPADGAFRYRAGRGSDGDAARARKAGGDRGCGGRRIEGSRTAHAQSVQGGHRPLQQRHHRTDHALEQRGNRIDRAVGSPASQRCADPSAGRRLEHRQPAAVGA
jgi:NodT family efflux transporter outer membrane factor (OMF) lipoprotein